jgi:hypothetical protein
MREEVFLLDTVFNCATIQIGARAILQHVVGDVSLALLEWSLI